MALLHQGDRPEGAALPATTLRCCLIKVRDYGRHCTNPRKSCGPLALLSMLAYCLLCCCSKLHLPHVRWALLEYLLCFVSHLAGEASDAHPAPGSLPARRASARVPQSAAAVAPVAAAVGRGKRTRAQMHTEAPLPRCAQIPDDLSDDDEEREVNEEEEEEYGPAWSELSSPHPSAQFGDVNDDADDYDDDEDDDGDGAEDGDDGGLDDYSMGRRRRHCRRATPRAIHSLTLGATRVLCQRAAKSTIRMAGRRHGGRAVARAAAARRWRCARATWCTMSRTHRATESASGDATCPTRCRRTGRTRRQGHACRL